MHRVGAPLRGVRGRTGVVGSDDFPGSMAIVLLRTRRSRAPTSRQSSKLKGNREPVVWLGWLCANP